MRLTQLTYLMLELNAALDTGEFDHITLAEVKEHIQTGDVFQWLTQKTGKRMDLSLYSPDDLAEITDELEGIRGAYGGNERRKWGVENRGLCLMLAWLNELVQQRRWQADD